MSAQPSDVPSRDFDVNHALTSGSRSGGSTRNARPRARRRRTDVENDAYTAFCSRIIRAAGRRIAHGDVEGLPDLLKLQGELDQALGVAVNGLREFGYSWAEIASRLGTSRQAVQQRWGSTPGGDRS